MLEHWEPWAVLAVIAGLLLALARSWAGPDALMLGGLTVLMVLGLFTEKLPSPERAVRGFGSEGLITVAVLFVVAEALGQTGAMQRLTAPLLGRPKSVLGAQARLLGPVAVLSAFLNNTPIVAMFLPVVNDWAKKAGLPASKLFIPLSYAAILGGTCTLIGTSTNLIVNALLRADDADHALNIFSIAWVGVPCTIVGLTYLLTVGRWLLPDRRPALSAADDPRQYTVEMCVEPASPLAGQSIEQAGLRQLHGLYLLEIERDGELFTAVGPEQTLREKDRLVFVGDVDAVVDLRKMRGLTPATDQVFKLDGPTTGRTLIEAVVSGRCPLIGRSIRAGRFRTVYNAAVIAVARDGQRIARKIGDIVLQPGDTLLLEAQPSFAQQQRNSQDFFLVSKLEGSAPLRHERAWVALVVLGAMVLAVSMGWLSMLAGALCAAGLMWVSRCVTTTEARRAVDWPVLVVIGGAIGIGQAVLTSGLAAMVADGILGLVEARPWLALAAVYLLTMVFTEMITNNAAAVLMYPIAYSTAVTLGVDVTPFAVAVMAAASLAFATPIGYQTNLMVCGPGGYRFGDYLRVGLPLNLLVMSVTLVVTPWAFPFNP